MDKMNEYKAMCRAIEVLEKHKDRLEMMLNLTMFTIGEKVKIVLEGSCGNGEIVVVDSVSSKAIYVKLKHGSILTYDWKCLEKI